VGPWVSPVRGSHRRYAELQVIVSINKRDPPPPPKHRIFGVQRTFAVFGDVHTIGRQVIELLAQAPVPAGWCRPRLDYPPPFSSGSEERDTSLRQPTRGRNADRRCVLVVGRRTGRAGVRQSAFLAALAGTIRRTSEAAG